MKSATSTYYGILTTVLFACGSITEASDLGTAFTYQGLLKDQGEPFDGSAAMVFELYDALTGGNLVGSDNAGSVTVSDGVFTVEVDFGVSPWTTNEARWLQVVVEGIPLIPRQPLTATPSSLATRGIKVDAGGNVQGAAGFAFGNDAVIGTNSDGLTSIWDLSHTITDFSAGSDWDPFRSIVTIDPDADIPSTHIYGFDIFTLVLSSNTHDIGSLEGPYLYVGHGGSGSVDYMSGGTSICVSGDTSVIGSQVGHGAAALVNDQAVVSENVGLGIVTGHQGAGGSIGNNYGLSVGTPFVDSPVTNNYGIYLADQDVAQVDNYAIYAAGGDTYLNGDVQSTARVAMGNDAYFGVAAAGQYPGWDRIFDLSHIITDFSSSYLWAPMLSVFVLNPDQDLTGANATFIYGHNFETHVSADSTHDISDVFGPYLATYDFGSGYVEYLTGTTAVTLVDGSGSVGVQTGLLVGSYLSDFSTGVISDNSAINVFSGNFGDPGSAVTADYGIYMQTPGTIGTLENHYGIYLQDQGVAQLDSYAIYSEGGDVYFNGDLEVTGNISKGGGSFKIDHPLDPENKYLYHSFVESPDMKNIYDGNVTTDAQGYAEVSMPDWFEALNRDFRYQLTVIGQFAQAIVAEEIAEGRFVIRTDKPNVKVSWQVTGIRHDAYAEANRIPVEMEKPENAKGRYLHPQAFGLTPDLREQPARAERDAKPGRADLRQRMRPEKHPLNERASNGAKPDGDANSLTIGELTGHFRD